jgi:hypothetical protein
MLYSSKGVSPLAPFRKLQKTCPRLEISNLNLPNVHSDHFVLSFTSSCPYGGVILVCSLPEFDFTALAFISHTTKPWSGGCHEPPRF